MYKKHSSFQEPNDPNVKVWRYLDFTKFVSLISTEKLFFTRADKFEDPFEGSIPLVNVQERRKSHQEYFEKDIYEKVETGQANFNQSWKRYVAINCWHTNEHESAAMWSIYLKSDEGLAIQSTFERFTDSFKMEEYIFAGQVKYIDYERDYLTDGNTLAPFMHKRKSYEHEREVRAIVMRPPSGDNGFDFDKTTIEHGVSVPVNIITLIEKIHISPKAPSWFIDLVKSVISKYGYDFEVVQSKLNDDALY